jgi:hypothetical protein
VSLNILVWYLLIWVKQAGYTAAQHGEEVCRFYVDGGRRSITCAKHASHMTNPISKLSW